MTSSGRSSDKVFSLSGYFKDIRAGNKSLSVRNMFQIRFQWEVTFRATWTDRHYLQHMLCIVLSCGKIEQSSELDIRAPEQLTQFSSPQHVVHTMGK